MVDLESLSNDQLRLRLLVYGFANMPVTQTTRKVFIKNHLDGEKSKTHRNMIHGTKYSSRKKDNVPATKKSNRRKIIAAPAVRVETP